MGFEEHGWILDRCSPSVNGWMHRCFFCGQLFVFSSRLPENMSYSADSAVIVGWHSPGSPHASKPLRLRWSSMKLPACEKRGPELEAEFGVALVMHG